MEVEDKLNEEMVQLEYLKRELEEEINTLNLLQYSQESVSRSLSGLDSLETAGKNEILIPYSNDIFFSGSLNDVGSALVSIGNNVYKRVNMAGLKKKLTEDFNELNKNIESLAKMISDLQEKGEKLENEINEMYQEMMKKQA